MSKDKDRFSVRTCSEARTGQGQVVQCWSIPDKADEVRRCIEENVYSLDVPVSHQVSIGHGGYGCYSRYDIQSHKYAGGGPGESGGWGYIEVLEIKNAPDGKWGIVINQDSSVGGLFTEWDELDSALKAFEKSWGSIRKGKDEYSRYPGFRRMVVYNELTPWFYAVGDQELIKDFVFPENVQDDPVYQFGQSFVVTDKDGAISVKVCMGTRFIEYEKHDTWGKQSAVRFRIVYWDDGSIWDESQSHSSWTSSGPVGARPLKADEQWIEQATRQFREVLEGKRENFTIDFIDGQKFVGKFVDSGSKGPTTAGDYLVTVKVRGEPKVRTGWFNDFTPTRDEPDIITKITALMVSRGHTVERIEIDKCKPKSGGKKWSGVFYA